MKTKNILIGIAIIIFLVAGLTIYTKAEKRKAERLQLELLIINSKFQENEKRFNEIIENYDNLQEQFLETQKVLRQKTGIEIKKQETEKQRLEQIKKQLFEDEN